MKEIENKTTGVDEITRTGSYGEPISRLGPSDFHLFQASLEKLGVCPEDAFKTAAKARLLQARTSRIRHEAISELAEANNPNALRHAEHKLDNTIFTGVRASLASIGAIPERKLQPIRVEASQPTVIFESRRR